MKLKSILLLLAFITLCSFSKDKTKEYIIMNYNVENLFDTIDDPEIIDEEFTPESNKKWNEERYQKKLADIAQVIAQVKENNLPIIIGLEEIENRKVITDLIWQENLKKANYKIVHYESPDKRGIDVALLYNPQIFKLKKAEVLPVAIEFPTRDILHVQGKIKTETFHIYINHWPSRIGGTEESEPYRIKAAETLKASIDKVQGENKKANIIVMGDMNDEPLNNSLYNSLGAQEISSKSKLCNLMLADSKLGKGSYNFRGTWNMLDNLIISKNLLDNKGLQVADSTGYIFRMPWMEHSNNKGEKSPNRTYSGPNYFGGVSDHFPVYFILK